MLTPGLIVQSVISILIVLLWFICSGAVILRVFKKNIFHSVFEFYYWSAITGLVFSVSVYAIIITGGKTCLLFCPLLILLFAWLKAGNHTDKKYDHKRAITFSVFGVIIFIVYYFAAFVCFEKDKVSFMNMDYLFYSRLAEYLNYTGNEVFTPEYLAPAKDPNPYHYGDMWLGAFVSRTFFLKPSFAFALVIYPVLSIIASFGVAAYLENKLKRTTKAIYLSVLMIFLSGFFSIVPRFRSSFTFIDISLGNYPKALFAFTLVAGIFLLLEKKDLVAAWILCAITGIMFIQVLPALSAAIGLISLFYFFTGKQYRQSILKGAAIYLFAIIYYFLFYRIVSGNASPVDAYPMLGDPVDNVTRNFLYQLWNRKNQVLLFLPAMIMIGLNIFLRRLNPAQVCGMFLKPDILFLPLIIITGFVTWLLSVKILPQSRQFYQPLLGMMVPFSMIVAGCWLVATSRKLIVSALAIAFLLAVSFKNRQFDYFRITISKEKWLTLKTFFDQHEEGVILSLKRNNEFPGLAELTTVNNQPIPELNYLFKTPYINETLNPAFMMKDSSARYTPAEKAVMMMTSFYAFSREDPNRNMDSAALIQGFARYSNARYFFVSDSSLIPSALKPALNYQLKLPEGLLYSFNRK